MGLATLLFQQVPDVLPVSRLFPELSRQAEYIKLAKSQVKYMKGYPPDLPHPTT